MLIYLLMLHQRPSVWNTTCAYPRDPGSLNLRMVSWNLNTFAFRRWLDTPGPSAFLWRSVSRIYNSPEHIGTPWWILIQLVVGSGPLKIVCHAPQEFHVCQGQKVRSFLGEWVIPPSIGNPYSVCIYTPTMIFDHHPRYHTDQWECRP